MRYRRCQLSVKRTIAYFSPRQSSDAHCQTLAYLEQSNRVVLKPITETY